MLALPVLLHQAPPSEPWTVVLEQEPLCGLDKISTGVLECRTLALSQTSGTPPIGFYFYYFLAVYEMCICHDTCEG